MKSTTYTFMIACFVTASIILFAACEKKVKGPDFSVATPNQDLAELMNQPVDKPEPLIGGPGNLADVLPPLPPAVVAAKRTETQQNPAESKELDPQMIDPTTIEVIQVDWNGYQKELAKLRGKTVVVDYWATWCVTCQAKFPKFLELKGKYAHQADVIFADAANEEEEDKLDDIRAFLASSMADTLHFRIAVPPYEFAEHLEVDGVPAYLIYSPDGEVVFRTNNVEDLATKLSDILK